MARPNRPALPALYLPLGLACVLAGIVLLGWGANHLWTRIDIPGAQPRVRDMVAFLGGFLVAGGGLHLLLLRRGPVAERGDR